MTTIVKATTKGQITLPAAWRRKYSTAYFMVTPKDLSLEITPLELARHKERQEYTVFDAVRDNKGKGIKARDLVKVLKKLR